MAGGELRSARRLCQDALGAVRRGLAGDPASPRLRRTFVHASLDRGEIELSAGQADVAGDALTEAEAMLRPLRDEAPLDPELARADAVLASRRAEVALASCRAAEARRLSADGARRLEDLARADPGSGLLLDLARAHLAEARVARAAGAPREAEELVRRASAALVDHEQTVGKDRLADRVGAEIAEQRASLLASRGDLSAAERELAAALALRGDRSAARSERVRSLLRLAAVASDPRVELARIDEALALARDAADPTADDVAALLAAGQVAEARELGARLRRLDRGGWETDLAAAEASALGGAPRETLEIAERPERCDRAAFSMYRSIALLTMGRRSDAARAADDAARRLGTAHEAGWSFHPAWRASVHPGSGIAPAVARLLADLRATEAGHGTARAALVRYRDAIASSPATP
jgi:hypothetical protein